MGHADLAIDTVGILRKPLTTSFYSLVRFASFKRTLESHSSCTTQLVYGLKCPDEIEDVFIYPTPLQAGCNIRSFFPFPRLVALQRTPVYHMIYLSLKTGRTDGFMLFQRA